MGRRLLAVDVERNMADKKKKMGGVDSELSSSYMGVVLQMCFIREVGLC